MSAARMFLFLAIVLSIWGAMHAFVFWRLASIPWVQAHLSRRTLLIAAIALWAAYPLSRFLDSWGIHFLSRPQEAISANWIGILFLLFAFLLVFDLATLGGSLIPNWAPRGRGWVAGSALALSLIALVQGFRAPVVRDYEVHLPGLPPERDGLVVVEISDLHLGTLIGQRWLSRLVERVNAMRPDLIVAVGDVVDGNVGPVEPLAPTLRELRAPLGVWAVTGNHEYYAGLDRSLALFDRAGFNVLRDRATQVAPGLVLAGVDDLTARRQAGEKGQPVQSALANRPPGATIYLSHSPLQAKAAAAAGAGLMLCGHTHNGQVWPFTYLVALSYPFVGGRGQQGAMPVIVCRGTGTWGPRMRLWRPSEIVRITLRSAPGQ